MLYWTKPNSSDSIAEELPVKKLRIWTACLFAAYLLLLLWAILFKGMAPGGGSPMRRSVNLIPFYADPYAAYLRKIAYRDWIVNVVAFVPFGILADCLFRRRSLWRPVLAGFCLSFLLELTQYIAGLGASDVTDLITNTAGAFAGILLFRLLVKLFGEKRSALIVNACGSLLLAVFLFLLLLVKAHA